MANTADSVIFNHPILNQKGYNASANPTVDRAADGFTNVRLKEINDRIESMRKLVIEHQDVLYRNPYPGHRAKCAFLPNVVPLDDLDLICIYRIGQAFRSVDGVLAQLRSRDGGLTWAKDGVIWDAARDEKLYNYTAPHAARMSDGELVLVAWRNNGSDPHRLSANPKTGGLIRVEHVLFGSSDDGRAWSAPRRLNLPVEATTDTPSQIIDLNSGRWFLA